MDFPICVQGRSLHASDIAWLESLIASNPQWNRSRLSRHIASHWHWTNAAGQLKDIAARSLLRKLEQRGLITLPPRQNSPPHSRRARRVIQPVLHATDPVREPLRDLRPVSLQLVGDSLSRDLFAHLLHAYHYLSYSRPVGENLGFLILDGTQLPLATEVRSSDPFARELCPE